VIAGLSSSITHQIVVHGVYAVFVLMAVDAVFPAASELVMLFAGAISAGAGGSALSLPGTHVGPGMTAYLVVAAVGTIGYLAGSIAGWFVGHRGGRQLVLRHGDSIHLSARRLERAERWFGRWGAAAVLVGRIVPFVRSFISIPAGIFEMPLLTYAVLTLAGSALWAFSLAGVGWALGASYTNVDQAIKYVEYAIVLAIAIAISFPFVARLRRRQTRTDARG
jgi:membrane protein DedA with SNARE-associated domain